MLESSPKRPLKDLASDPNTPFTTLITHDKILSCIRNQESILGQIFTSRNVYELISYINQEHAVSDNAEMAIQLPYMAMQILCCECHLITEIIFSSQLDRGKGDSGQTGQLGNKESDISKQDSPSTIPEQEPTAPTSHPTHLLSYLLTFLQHPQHYMLASYFNKVMIALTKRVFSVSHRYNAMICHKVFNQLYLFQCINHLYSFSFHEIVLKWLTLKGPSNNPYTELKTQFVRKLIKIINNGWQNSVIEIQYHITAEQKLNKSLQLNNMCAQTLQSSMNLIQLLLRSPLTTQTQSQPRNPQYEQQHKNPNIVVNKTSQKQLYLLVCNYQALHEIMKPVPSPNMQKIMMIHKIINTMLNEYEAMGERDDDAEEVFIGQIIDSEMLTECFFWVNEQIRITAERICPKQGDIGSQAKTVTDNTAVVIDSTTTEQAANSGKQLLLELLDLLHTLHSIPQLQQTTTIFYQEHERDHVELISRLLLLKNDIVLNRLTKIMVPVLKANRCPDFSRTLLYEGICTLFDVPGISEHVTAWARIILATQQQKNHIFQNAQESAKWDHMLEIVNAAEQIQIGKFRFMPCLLEVVYSTEKARKMYAGFMNKPIYIEYEDRVKLRRNISSPPVMEGIEGRGNGKVEQEVVGKANKTGNPHSHLEQTTITSPTFQPQTSNDPPNAENLLLQNNEQLTSDSNQGTAQKAGIEWQRAGYLAYRVEDVIKELE